MKSIWTLIFCFALASACQPYQNLVSRYNPYFLAREKTTAVTNQLFPLVEDDFIHYLPVLVPLDTAKAGKDDLNYIIDKASIPVRRLKRSKWIDDCYVLIGKARLYSGDISNAVITFNYVTNNSVDANARHTALVMLLKTFMFAKEYNNFHFVKNYILERESLFNDQNSRDYHLTLADFYYRNEAYAKVLDHILLAFKHFKTRAEKAHYHYILGQIYEEQKQVALAFEHYNKARHLSNNYELFFHAQIRGYRLKYFENPKDTIKITKFYNRLLKEDRNWDYRDEIYYELGNYKLQHKQFEEALHFYRQSVSVSSKNNQKAYSFFRMAKIYEKELNKYRPAADHYDSAFQNMPEHYELYDEALRKATIFKRFARYYDLVQEQKKLVGMYNLPKKVQRARFEAEIETEKETIIRNLELAKLNSIRRRKRSVESNNLNSDDEAGGWYFYNTKSKVLGSSDFLRIWGDRPLTDNWRLTSKIEGGEAPLQSLEDFQKFLEQDKPVLNLKSVKPSAFSKIEPLEERLAKIPKNSAQLKAMTDSLSENLLNLGLSYQDDLENYRAALQTFQEIIRYKYENEMARALYLSYWLCQNHFDLNCDGDTYKYQLFRLYPKHELSQRIRNPNYEAQLEVRKRKISRSYYRAYNAFKNNALSQAAAEIKSALKNYPENEYKEKFELLQTMVLGRRGNYEAYQNALKTFIDHTQDTTLREHANLLLKKYMEKDIK